MQMLCWIFGSTAIDVASFETLSSIFIAYLLKGLTLPDALGTGTVAGLDQVDTLIATAQIPLAIFVMLQAGVQAYLTWQASRDASYPLFYAQLVDVPTVNDLNRSIESGETARPALLRADLPWLPSVALLAVLLQMRDFPGTLAIVRAFNEPGNNETVAPMRPPINVAERGTALLAEARKATTAAELQAIARKAYDVTKRYTNDVDRGNFMRNASLCAYAAFAGQAVFVEDVRYTRTIGEFIKSTIDALAPVFEAAFLPQNIRGGVPVPPEESTNRTLRKTTYATAMQNRNGLEGEPVSSDEWARWSLLYYHGKGRGLA